MDKQKFMVWMALLLAAFFAIGGIGNILAGPEILGDYARWGYPSGFNYITGVLELVTALMLCRSSYRFLGALLAVVVMASATITVLVHGEFTHAIAPLVVLCVATVIYVASRRSLMQSRSTDH